HAAATRRTTVAPHPVPDARFVYAKHDGHCYERTQLYRRPGAPPPTHLSGGTLLYVHHVPAPFRKRFPSQHTAVTFSFCQFTESGTAVPVVRAISCPEQSFPTPCSTHRGPAGCPCFSNPSMRRWIATIWLG